jgi:serine/threonine-protein kinase HipA
MTPLWPYFDNGPNRFNHQAGRHSVAHAAGVPRKLDTIQPRHWHQLAMKRGPAVWEAMQALVERVEPALIAVEEAAG